MRGHLNNVKTGSKKKLVLKNLDSTRLYFTYNLTVGTDMVPMSIGY